MTDSKKSIDIGRNDPCHCGSRKKYKKCCEAKDDAARLKANEKQMKEAQKDFDKKKAEEAKANEKSATPSAHTTPPANTSPAHQPKHQTVSVPKFNMSRRTGGG